MGKVLDALLRRENALLESPTGTGKTLCLLCSTLAWQREQKRIINDPEQLVLSASLAPSKQQPQRKATVPTIIYASRTHSQLSQVVRELRNTRYRPKHAVLGSREQMCVNPKVKKPDGSSTASDINHNCSTLCRDRRCKFKNNVEGFNPPMNESSSQSTHNKQQPVMDMEDLVIMGKKHNVCPFYYTREQVANAELVLLPYNYLFEKDSRSITLSDIPWNNAVVIFDEAHNLESFASDSASFDFSSKDIAGCMKEIDKALNLHESFPERFPIKTENLIRLKALFLKLEEYLLRELPQQSMSYKGERIIEIFGKGAKITYENHTLVLGEIKKVFEMFMEVRGSNSKGAPYLELFSKCLKRVFGEPNIERVRAKTGSYRVHLTSTAGEGGRTLSYWCFAPSEAMRELSSLGVRSILVTSGTLSPLESYAMELDLEFPNRLENPHIISPSQIYVRVMGRGVSNKELTSSYERRQNNDYYIELGNTLASLSRVIPCGMLVFFPSYGVMETSIERWGGPASSRSSGNKKSASNFFAAKKRRGGAGSGNSSRYSFPQLATSYGNADHLTPWKRLLSHKAVVIEPKSSSDLPDAIAEFHRFLSLPKSKGVALFGVCRGKISEGIDFSHDMCRAVIITGLPFAPSFDPKVKMKREFLDQKKANQSMKPSTNGGFGANNGAGSNSSLSGHAWYTQQAHRAVNQAIGRVIRNKQDYGAVLLMDSRFGLKGNQNGLSKWVRPHILSDEGFGRANQKLAQFYTKAKENAEREAQKMAVSEPVATKPTNVSMILKYEDEENMNNRKDSALNEDEITKVAIIKEASKAQIKNATHGNYVDPQRVIARVDINDLQRGSLITPSTAKPQQALPSQEKKATQSRSTSPAVQFFRIIQSTMTKEEFVSIKKNIALMTKNSDLKFRKEFISAVRETIKLLLHHEPFYSRSKNEKPELLCLLLKLIPKHFLSDVQQVTVDVVFRGTKIRNELKLHLELDRYKKVHMEFVDFLQQAWFEKGFDQTNRQCAQKLGKILSGSAKCIGVTKSGLSQFSDVVPSEMRRLTLALIEEIKVSREVSKIKADENFRTKQPLVKAEYFRKNYQTNNVDKDNLKKKNEEIQNNAPKQAKNESKPHSNPQEVQKKIKPMKNPYAKNTNASCVPSTSRQNVSKPSTQSSVRQKSTLGSIVEKKKRSIEHGGVSSSANSSLDNVLRQSGSETFAGSMKKMRRTIFDTNAPKNAPCTICDLRLEKLYISQCGHMACLSCVSFP